MSFHIEDTICAIATAPGGAARGMVRVSGQSAIAVAASLFEATDHRRIESITRTTALSGRARIDLDAAPRFLPCDLLLWPTNKSYTREPVAELHTIGSPPLLESMLASVCRAGARLAEPGEFTLRAFLAGRLDLTQAEAVLGVIDSRGNEDLGAALAQLAGGLARPLYQLREELLQLLAELEAGLDFVEEDIEFISQREIRDRVASASQLLDNVAQQMASRHVANDARQIALVGPPNVGKSSLFNALVERFACDANPGAIRSAPALVSPRRGTTRDYLTATISLNDIRCELVDTAGIDDPSSADTESTTSTIDSTAQTLALDRCKRAVIRACCIEAQCASHETALPDDCDIVVLTKSDIWPHRDPSIAWSRTPPAALTSSRTGQGLDELCAALHALLMRDESAQRGQVVSATADRCRESVRLAGKSLDRAAELVLTRGGNELVAVELRAALEELGKVVGAVYTDDILDRIFGTFCIGK